jgi:hypothetical protein
MSLNKILRFISLSSCADVNTKDAEKVLCAEINRQTQKADAMVAQMERGDEFWDLNAEISQND